MSYGDFCLFSLHFFNCRLSNWSIFFEKVNLVFSWGLLQLSCGHIYKKNKENKVLCWRQITLIETIFFYRWLANWKLVAWKNSFWRIVHTQVDYYNMLLVRGVREWQQSGTKNRPKHCHKNKKHKKLRRRTTRRKGREIERRKAKLAEGCLRDREKQIPLELKLLSRMKGDLSHKSTYKRKPSRITMINKC